MENEPVETTDVETIENEGEQYGFSLEEWNATTEEEKESYRGVGQQENKSEMAEEVENA